MLQGGFFIGGIGGGSAGGSGNSPSDIHVDNDGNIIYDPFDPIYIDDNENVFLSEESKNARMYIEDGNLFVERLV